MQTLIVRAYVTAYGNSHAHRLKGEMLTASIRVTIDDAAFLNIPTTIDIATLSRLHSETLPRSFVIDMDSDGAVVLRLPRSEAEFAQCRPLSTPAQVEALRWKLRHRSSARLVSRHQITAPQAAPLAA